MDSKVATELSERIGNVVDMMQEHGKVLHRVDKTTSNIYKDFRKVRRAAYIALALSALSLLSSSWVYYTASQRSDVPVAGF